MIIRVVHAKTGHVYEIPVTQVSVHNNLGEPLAISYEHDGLIVHSDLLHPDFNQSCEKLGIKKLKV